MRNNSPGKGSMYYEYRFEIIFFYMHFIKMEVCIKTLAVFFSLNQESNILTC